jgi:hypothetical protein
MRSESGAGGRCVRVLVGGAPSPHGTAEIAAPGQPHLGYFHPADARSELTGGVADFRRVISDTGGL